MDKLPYTVRWEPFPNRPWYVIRPDGEIERFGVPSGRMPRRFASCQAAQKVADQLNAVRFAS